MLRGLFRLTWLEIKIFAREPLGLFGSVGVPSLIYLGFGRFSGGRVGRAAPDLPTFISADLPILASLLIVLSAVLSLVAIVAIYREAGILKRLRATPLRPTTILTAHVIVKLLFTTVTLLVMVILGRRYFPVPATVPFVSFAVAFLFSTVCILSLGFLIASVVPTARFAQPIGTLFLYPMLGLSGLFVPIESLPPFLQAVARALPVTYTVALLRGIWRGEGWVRHTGDVAILTLMLVAFGLASTKVFRWE
jgi:ABC-2 type transport system permease protein